MTGPIATLFAAALAALAPAQDGDRPRCTACDHVGLVECEEHRRLELEHEPEVRFCSFVHGCEVCGGTGWVDCEECESPEVERANAAKRERVEAIAARLAEELDGPMERELRKAESDHFTLVWEVDELKVDKRRLDDHQLLHLYLRRMEALYDAYVETFGVEDAEFERKVRLLVWSFPQDHLRAAQIFCGSSAQRGVKLLGANPSYSVPALRRFFRDDESLHRNLVHNVAHLLLSHQRPSRWIGPLKGGWADAGVAHWFEDRFFGVCDNYCYQEVDTQRGFEGGRWRPAVRELVAEDEDPPAAGVMRKNTTVLTPEEHALAFSYVDFLIATDAAEADALFRRLRGKEELRDALRETFGWSVLAFQAAWREWVLATYPKR